MPWELSFCNILQPASFFYSPELFFSTLEGISPRQNFSCFFLLFLFPCRIWCQVHREKNKLIGWREGERANFKPGEGKWEVDRRKKRQVVSNWSPFIVRTSFNVGPIKSWTEHIVSLCGHCCWQECSLPFQKVHINHPVCIFFVIVPTAWPPAAKVFPSVAFSFSFFSVWNNGDRFSRRA